MRLPFEPLLQGRAPYGLYYAALVATAWLFSVRATLLASGLSLIGAWYLTLPPRFTFAVPSLPDLASLMFFAATAAILTVLARSAARIRQNLAQLAVIVRASDDAIVRQRTDGTIETWNAGAERIYGYTADEIIGRTVWLLVPADRRGEEERSWPASGAVSESTTTRRCAWPRMGAAWTSRFLLLPSATTRGRWSPSPR